MEKLTRQETEILKKIIKGRNNPQISKDTNLSIHTVKAHISSILRKLEAKNRVNAVYIALKYKIIDE